MASLRPRFGGVSSTARIWTFLLAACVYPTLVKIAKDALKGTGIKVAAVATGFPSGQYPLSTKLEDTKFADDQGAEETGTVQR